MPRPTYKNISIIGDGGMGTVLAMLLCQESDRHTGKAECAGQAPQGRPQVKIWGHDREQLQKIARCRENKQFLPGYRLPEDLVFQPDDARIMAGADLIVSAVPCQYMRRVWSRLAEHTPPAVPIVSVAKGIENGTLLRPTQILAEVLAAKSSSPGPARRFAVLSGPTIADELARRLPATACVACDDDSLAQSIQHMFSQSIPNLRLYTNTDTLGVELAGAMKNVIAIAAGIIDGMGLGDNAKAALLTRGLAEITRLGVAMGARPQTFAGLAGLGDLVTTCISPSGRNRSFGERIGKGLSLEQARQATRSVVEGIATCKSMVALATRYDVEMPITRATYQVLFEDKPVATAVAELMHRQLKAE